MIKRTGTKDGTDNTVPVEIAKQMTEAFRKSQNAESGTYTKAAWFPAAQMTSLVKKMAELDGDGIRIYFGRYTSDIISQINKLEYGDKIPDSYVDMNTVLLVITKMVDGKPATDYFVEKGYTHKHHGGKLCDTPPTDPENRGELCPTFCDEKSPLSGPE